MNMTGTNFVGSPGKSIRPVNYQPLRAGQFRGYGGANIFTNNTTIITNNYNSRQSGYGTYGNYNCGGGGNKFMNWMMGLGLASGALGSILSMFGKGKPEAAPETKIVAEDPNAKKIADLEAKNKENEAKLAELNAKAEALKNGTTPVVVKPTENGAEAAAAKPTFGVIKTKEETNGTGEPVTYRMSVSKVDDKTYNAAKLYTMAAAKYPEAYAADSKKTIEALRQQIGDSFKNGQEITFPPTLTVNGQEYGVNKDNPIKTENYTLANYNATKASYSFTAKPGSPGEWQVTKTTTGADGKAKTETLPATYSSETAAKAAIPKE